MAKSLNEKLFLKPDYERVIIHVPEELQGIFQKKDISDSPNRTYHFILAFYLTKNDLEKEVNVLKNSLEDDGLLWLAYPKGKALKTDLSRDILHQYMKEYGFDGVSIISLNDTWSALRFKKIH